MHALGGLHIPDAAGLLLPGKQCDAVRMRIDDLAVLVFHSDADGSDVILVVGVELAPATCRLQKLSCLVVELVGGNGLEIFRCLCHRVRVTCAFYLFFDLFSHVRFLLVEH